MIPTNAQHNIDWLVLTAANRAQAVGFRAQLKGRNLPARHWCVVPDPGGRRAGSGGSTLWVLYRLAMMLLDRRPSAHSIRDLFEARRIVIIHSGGDSRRLCAYAAQGKIFLPLPCSLPGGEQATLFDLILGSLVQLPAPPRGQCLIASGDVLLNLDPAQIDFAAGGVTGVAYPGPMERGVRHGVYVTGRDGRVIDFLQKPDEATARDRGAVDSVGRVLVDTGLVSLDPEAAERFLRTAGVEIRHGRLAKGAGLLRAIVAGKMLPLDLYEHILIAIAARTDLEAYRQRVILRTPVRYRRLLSRLHAGMHGLPFRTNTLSHCEFFHIGSSAELLANIGTLNRTAKAYGFANYDRSVVADRSALEGAFVYNSLLRSPDVRAGEGVVLESSHCLNAIELKGRNLVVGIPKECGVDLRLPAGWGLVCLPLGRPRHAWSAVLFGIDDDFKTPEGAGGTFGNSPMTEFIERHALQPGQLWPNLPQHRRTLWEARMWTIGGIDTVLRNTQWMSTGTRCRSGWLRQRRVSMADLLGRVDAGRVGKYRSEIQRIAELNRLGARLQRDPWFPAARVLELLRDKEDEANAMHQIDKALGRTAAPLDLPRLYQLAHIIHARSGATLPSRPRLRGRALAQAPYRAVAQAVARQIPIAVEPRPAQILHDQVVWATCPVRVDLAGGWSDTPPICNELGGTVLNAAITLNGQYPVQVVAKLSERRRILLTSLDLGERVEITRTPSPAEYQDPTVWCSLPKAALVLSGVCPPGPRPTLEEWLKILGGGLEITVFSAVPKGSGLGTSSIIGAAMIACMARVVGEAVSRDTIIARASLLEQIMTTAGGWQDQVGGTVPGVKLIRTTADLIQVPQIQWIPFDLTRDGELRSRLLLYYTGYRRMARNILQNIVGRYLARDGHVVGIIPRLKELAEKMNSDLAAHDFDAFGNDLEQYWILKKSIDPGATNGNIERILRPLEGYLAGRVLPGAGGGGFILMMARDSKAAGRIRTLLERHPPNAEARFFDFDIDNRGLAISVL